ncbi:MAG: hypothetical protein P8Y03_31195, partial [Anaerolineales bacterium]
GWLNFLRLPLKDDPCPSLAWQGFNKLTHQIDGGFFVLPGLTIMLAEKRIRGCDDNHVELIQQDDQLPAMSPGKAEMMLAGLGGPPAIAISKVAERKAHSVVTGFL